MLGVPEAVVLDAIAKLGMAGFHVHFGGREQLLLAVHAELGRRMEAARADALARWRAIADAAPTADLVQLNGDRARARRLRREVDRVLTGEGKLLIVGFG